MPRKNLNSLEITGDVSKVEPLVFPNPVCCFIHIWWNLLIHPYL